MDIQGKALIALLLVLPGCELQGHWERLKAEGNALLVVLQGGKSPLAEPRKEPSEGAESEGARASRVNSELFQEIYRVVLMREPRDRNEFGSWVDVLNQGASLEGIYNGMTHSAAYRELEQSSGAAAPEAVRLFAEETVVLQGALVEPTEFSPASAKPLEELTPYELAQEPEPLSGERPSVDALATLFAGASVFTLKRVIGDEALKALADQEKKGKEAQARWYARWAARLAERGTDFGIPKRNDRDEQLHYSWALSASRDLLTWEVLNRVHRLVNQAERKARPAKSDTPK